MKWRRKTPNTFDDPAVFFTQLQFWPKSHNLRFVEDWIFCAPSWWRGTFVVHRSTLEYTLDDYSRGY